jgi:hypothetical protein
MNLSNSAPETPGGPKLDMGSINDVKKNKRTPETDSDLWQQQQGNLARLRQKLCELVSRKLAGEDCDSEIAATFKMLSGHLHFGDWDSLFPVFEAIAKLGPNYHHCIVVLGGWHHVGKLANLNPPDKCLLDMMRGFRGLVNTSTICRQMIKGGQQNWNTNLPKLRKCVGNYWDVLPGYLWDQPDQLLKFIDQQEPLAVAEIENALLFMHPRIFAFSPIAKNSFAGWQDFERFVFAYQRLVKQFASDFGKYHWGIFCK